MTRPTPTRLLFGLAAVFAAAGAPPGALAQEPIRFARHPSLSPDGSWIAFDYQGDVWRVPAAGGVAQRLTAHAAYDHDPHVSPDGNWIAWMSDRHGNEEILVMPSGGGVPSRLTHHSGTDTLSSWTPDSERLVFTSLREYSHLGPAFYSVGLAGSSTPALFMDALGSDLAVSPDGSRVAFQIGATPWWRRRYRGSASHEIWVRDTTSKAYQRWTEFEGDDRWPMWTDGGAALLYVSDRDGAANLYLQSAPRTEPRRITSFESDPVRFPAISADGSRIAFERGLDVWTCRADGGEAAPVEIRAPRDELANPFEDKTWTRDAGDLAIHPEGKAIAFVAGGDVFVVGAEHGGRARALSEGPARERGPAWTPDGKAVIFATDERGNYDLVRVESSDAKVDIWKSRKFKRTWIATTDAEESLPKVDPTGKHLAYVRGNGDLLLSDTWGDRPRVLFTGWNVPEFVFSPDGRWIAYSAEDEEFNADVFLVPVDGSSPAVNVSQHPDSDVSPSFSGDGRVLAFASRRHGDTGDVWFVYLRSEDDLVTNEEWQERWREDPDESAAKAADGAKKDPKAPPEVKIDVDRIWERARPLTDYEGDEGSPIASPDGKTVAFTANRDGSTDLYTIRRDGAEMKRLTTGGVAPSALSWSRDGKALWFLRSGGVPAKVPAAGGAVESIDFAAETRIDLEALRRRSFEEAWRELSHNFYDPGFHGIDWVAARDTYRPYALAAAHRRDFLDAVNLMLGELDASHLGASGYAPAPGPSTGHLGIRFEIPPEGPGVVVEHVFERLPASRPESRLEAGERIVSVDGRNLARGEDFYARFAGREGEEVLLGVHDAQGKEREVPIRPSGLAAVREALYLEWVRDRRGQTARLSNYRVGYVHIQSMNEPSLETFERELYSVGHGREGLVIDVRYNGGGWTTDYLLTMLTVRRHAVTVPRDGKPGYPQDRLPYYAWTRPITVLANERSFSNAEIFAHAVKTLKRGAVVGKTTHGAVISTGGTALADGTFLRLPFRGWYVVGTGVNMERQGAVPDFDVENFPGEEPAGRDRQLEKAVAALLEEIERWKRDGREGWGS